MLLILALGKQRLEDLCEFGASLVYIVGTCLETKQNKNSPS